MANEFVTRTGLIVSGSTYLPAATSASKGYILSFDTSTKEVYYMSTSSVTVTVPGSNTQVIYNNNGSFGAASNFVFSGSSVGIGTTSPGTTLDVAGTFRVTGSASTLGTFESSNSSVFIGLKDSSGDFVYLGNDDGDFLVQTPTGGYSTKLIVKDNGNVGIGISSPTALLHIAKNATYNNVSNTALRVANVTSPNKAIDFGYDNTADVGYIQGIEFGVQAKNLTLQSDGGNVGIGITSPAYKLDVQGSAGNIARITDGTSHFLFYAGSGLNEIATTGPFLFTVSGSERMRITTAGNVGIGTTSPAAKLDVVGSAGIRVNEDGIGTKVISIRSDFAGVDPAINVSTNNALLLQTNNTERMRIAAGGNVGIGTTSPNAKLDVNGNVIVTGSLTVSGSSTFTNIGPAVFTGSITQNASTASFGGVVGIGTTTPSARLDIAGDSEGRYLEVNAFAGFAGLSSGSSAMVELLNGGDGNTLFIKTENSARNDAAPLAVWTNNNPRLLVRNDGNVGIGTASPSGKLDIVPSSQNGINIARAGGYASIYGSNDLVFETDSVFYFGVYTPRLFSVNGSFYTTVSGDVGVNTSSPTDKFHVQNGRISVTSGSTFGLSIEASGSGGRGGIISTKAGSDWNPVMYFTSQSRVGIGTGTPSTTLDVSGTGRFSGDVTVGLGNALENLVIINGQTYSGVRFQRSSTTKWAIFNNNAGTDFIDFYNYSTNSSAFYISPTNAATFAAGVTATSFTGSFSGSVSAPGSTTQIVYNSGGALAADSGLVYSGSRVGIGTSSPNATLDVNGNVYVRPNGVLYTDTLAGYTSNVVSLAASTNLVTATGRIGVGTANPNSGSLQIYTAASTNQLVLNGGSGYTNVYAGNFVGNLYLATNYYYSGGHVSDDASKRSMEINMTNDEILFATMPAGSPGTRTRLMTISGSQGFIGIGTTTPAATLDVNGGSIIRGNLTLAGGSRYITGDGGDLFIDTENVSGRDILLQTVSGQKVGIGTTTPSYLLDVNGTARFLGNAATSPASIFNNATGASGTAQYYSEYTAGATTIGRIFRGNGASGVVGNGLNIDNYDGFQIRANQLGGSGGTINLLGGNVGINTNVPVAKLHIQESSTARALIQVVGSEAAGDNAGLYFKSAVNYSDAYMKGGVFFSNNGSGHGRGNLILANNNTADGTNVSISDAKLTVTADGDIQVSGSGYISGSLTVAGTITAQKLNVQQITSSVVYSSGSNIFGNSLANTQTFTGSIQATGSSHYFLGSVGIGTTGPGAPLDVYGSLNSGKSIIRVTNSDTVNYITLGAGIPGVSNAGMNFTLDGSSKMVISAGGNVGIGTSTPGYLLDVKGTGRFDGNVQLYAGSAGNSPRLIFGGETSSTDKSIFLESYYMVFQGHDNEGFKFNTTTSGGSVTNRMVILGSGNVGIGTTTPSTKLHVVGAAILANNTNINPDSYGSTVVAGAVGTAGGWGLSTAIGGNAGVGHSWALGSNGDNFYMGYENGSSANSMQTFLQVDDSTRNLFLVPSSGNVGIGTTSPSSLFTVAGTSDLAFSDSSNLLRINRSSGVARIQNYNGGAAANLSLNWEGGNVGIGTTTPAQKLEIFGLSDVALRIHKDNVGETIIGISGSAGADATQFITNTNGFDFRGDSNTFPGGGSSRLFISSSGNVGIGTTSPTNTLDVLGSATIRNSSGGGALNIGTNSGRTEYQYITLGGGTGGTDYGWQVGRSPQTGGVINDGFYIYDIKTNNAPFAIALGGNVGIGTTIPASRLQVTATSTSATTVDNGITILNDAGIDGCFAGIRLSTYGDADGGLYPKQFIGAIRDGNFGAGKGSIVFYNRDAADTSVVTASDEKMRILPNGNVGIGTTNPSNKVTVKGGTLSAGSEATYALHISNGTKPVTIGSDDNYGYIQTFSSAPLSINSQGNNVIFTNASTQVGIGTANPAVKLDIQGSNTGTSLGDGMFLKLKNTSTTTNTRAGIVFGNIDGIGGSLAMQSAILKNAATGEYDMTWDLYGGSAGWQEGLLYLDSNPGRVGIGTTSPSYKLDVAGVGRLLSVGIIQASSNSDTPNIAFTNNGTSFTWGTIGGLLQGDGDGALFFNTKIGGSVTEKMRITSAGNVGIGTSSPNAKLQVIGPSLTVNDENTYGLWVSETGDDTKAIILGYDQGIDAGIITAVDKATAWKNLILQPNLGGVGVGTTSPSYKFQVSESIAIENQGTITIESTTFSGSLTGNTNIAFVPTASFKAAFFDYYVASGSVNMRAGTVMAVHNNSTSRYTDTSTADIGTTAAVDFSTSIVAGSLVLTANISSGTWEVKTAYRAL